MKSVYVLTFTALLALGCAHVRDESKYHLGKISAPCAEQTKETCPIITEDLPEIDRVCTKLETECAAGDRLLNRLFTDTRQYKFANYIIYFEQTRDPKTKIVTFKEHQPILMWNEKNTRYLYGVQEVHILIFTENKACFAAQLTDVTRNEPNPFDVVLKMLGKGVGTSDGQPPLQTHPAQFAWFPLDGNFNDPVMWVAIGDVPVEMNTIDWITVRFLQPPKSGKSASDQPEECVDDKDKTYKAPFLARNAFFSNNRESRFAVSLAFGATYARGNTSATGTSGFNMNGYALAKYYPRARFMPTLESEHDYKQLKLQNRRSVGLVVGTNVITNSPFKELIAGASLGHIVGNVGVIGGMDFFIPQSNKSTTDTTTASRRRHLPFVGVEYSF